MTSLCRNCGASVRWLQSAATGNLIPVDIRPSENGNIIVQGNLAVTLRGGDLFEAILDGPRFCNHFATCSAAGGRQADEGSA